MKTRTVLILLFVLSSLVLGILGYNVTCLWGLWILALGMFLGVITSHAQFTTPTVCIIAALILAVIGAVAFRRLPIHSLDSSSISKLEISPITDDWTIQIDQSDYLQTLAQYMNRGYYKTIPFSGGSYRIEVWHLRDSGGLWANPYFVHTDAIGPMPGGFTQTVFCPAKRGFGDWLNTIISENRRAARQRGHEAAGTPIKE